MSRPNYNLIRFIRRNISTLKKEYGGPITVYKLESTTTNLDTGVKTHTRTSQYIRRAVVLPATLSREVTQTISLISANKKIVQGGSYDVGKRRFIIDRQDVPSTFTIDNDDWIVYDGVRYEFIAVEEFEQKTAWLVVAKAVHGDANVEEDHYAKSNSYLLDLTQTVNVTVS